MPFDGVLNVIEVVPERVHLVQDTVPVGPECDVEGPLDRDEDGEPTRRGKTSGLEHRVVHERQLHRWVGGGRCRQADRDRRDRGEERELAHAYLRSVDGSCADRRYIPLRDECSKCLPKPVKRRSRRAGRRPRSRVDRTARHVLVQRAHGPRGGRRDAAGCSALRKREPPPSRTRPRVGLDDRAEQKREVAVLGAGNSGARHTARPVQPLIAPSRPITAASRVATSSRPAGRVMNAPGERIAVGFENPSWSRPRTAARQAARALAPAKAHPPAGTRHARARRSRP